MYELPLVDISKFTSEQAIERDRCVEAIGNAFEGVGFVAIEGHGIAPQCIEQVRQQLISSRIQVISAIFRLRVRRYC